MLHTYKKWTKSLIKQKAHAIFKKQKTIKIYKKLKIILKCHWTAEAS